MIQLHPDYVVFDEIECCAMAQIYERLKPKPGKLIDQALGIFKNSLSLGFIPSEFEARLYPHVALNEGMRLAMLPLETRLPCGHKQGEHIVALGMVKKNLLP